MAFTCMVPEGTGPLWWLRNGNVTGWASPLLCLDDRRHHALQMKHMSASLETQDTIVCDKVAVAHTAMMLPLYGIGAYGSLQFHNRIAPGDGIRSLVGERLFQ